MVSLSSSVTQGPYFRTYGPYFRSFRHRFDGKRRRNEAFEFDSNCQAPQRAWQFESNSNPKEKFGPLPLPSWLL